MSQNRTHFSGAKGLYHPEHEHDACGVGFIADIKNRKSHKIVQDGLEILLNLTHRGAVGADPREGDGAGILIQLPDQFFRRVCSYEGVTLPDEGGYGVGMLFLPQDPDHIQKCKTIIETVIQNEGQNLLGWRRVPTDRIKADLPESVTNCEPVIEQVFIGSTLGVDQQDSFERKLYVIRKQIELQVSAMGLEDEAAFYIPSMSSRVIVYKGMFLSHQVGAYYEDLSQQDMTSALALVHQRFSTNTFPAWELSHPFRMIAHNGEINTVRGNVNWMRARRHSMASAILGDDLEKLWPLIEEGQSDSACFDNALELLVAGGYSLAHAAMLMIPEAWSGNSLMDPARKAFYEYYSAVMEPWDGPAAMAFTDGRQIGATLDRNGLRPARYLLTKDDLVIMSSEAGVLPVDERDIVRKWRLQPGKMFLIDLQEGRIIDDAEIKQKLASEHPYGDILKRTQIRVDELPGGGANTVEIEKETLSARQQAFGMTKEDVKFLMTPMAVAGQEAIGSMGTDTPLAVLSDHAKPLYNYFQQLFAQVTNPPIDPLREEMVMSLTSIIGPRPNLLDLDHSEPDMRLEVDQPILTDEAFDKIARIGEQSDIPFQSNLLSICYPADQGKEGMQAALDQLCNAAEQAVRSHVNILILSDMDADQNRIAIPALLATAAVHHHLIREGLRTETGLIVQTGSAREVHHFALLAGYGAEAIHPYLAYQTLADIRQQGHLPEDISAEEAIHRYIKAVDKGLLKVMSKMGISTYQSYCGAQIFEAIGLRHDFVEKYFTGTTSQIEGIGVEEVAMEAVKWHERAYQKDLGQSLPDGGEYAWRVNGESHMWTPETISLMQHAVRAGDYGLFKQFSAKINDQSRTLMTLRGLFEFSARNKPVPLEEVEPAEEIVKRFATGAMSYGSISHEAHTTLAIAMNRLGAKSNTGEGGEDPERFTAHENGDLARSAIKQVASGRFGVTTEYLVNADAIQIKIAQGAKPGEGGQLPGHKVNETIARVRHSTQGVGLISPPPHHDIYSIEDIAQLIFDLKNVNPRAAISVKLVSEVGVGTVAAGVVKAHADHVTVSGFDGGTGASPLTSIKHAGGPWELGLAETQQTLVLNRLRGRMRLQVDGQMRTGRDIVIGALLGADEFGFGTAALVSEGCIMMRKCHLNTCPVGVATQDPELRKRFTGKPEHVVNFFMFVAAEVREIMAELGFRTFNEMIGRTDCLNVSEAIKHWKSENLDLSPILHRQVGVDTAIYHQEQQDHGLEKVIDNKLIEMAKPALDNQVPVQIEIDTNSTQRSFGAMLSGELARRYGHAGLQEDTIHIKARGTAGQSFGAWLANGITLELQGDANDYVGKGLSGGHIIIYPSEDSSLKPEENIIVGNTVLYGAISGECYFSGVAGERFAVRNSGAIAVVEGVGDHGCEYMTGGTVVVLGQSGRNFAAGMSGGIAYVLDESGDFEHRCNMAMVSLEPIESESDAIEKLDYQGADLETHGRVDVKHSLDLNDERFLWVLVRRHLHYTNSQRARTILENWKQYREKFVKVMPVDYKRALHEMERMRQEAASMQSEEKANG